ncbi:MAG TPA: FHA domain-containing protein [Gemmataceae bacterium]|jgi:predicted component of type VI protein secretion system|nr:FHA domain-containing protein [Gemmataceae bacterium]
MPAQLVALNAGPGILVDKPILLIGRDLECDIQIDSRKVSRRHCVLAQIADYLVIRDLGSTNGVRINGVRVKEGRLQPGDELTIGSLRYQVSFDAKPRKEQDFPALRRAKPVAQANLIRDEDLESCEDPVALPEPGQAMPPPVGRPVVRNKENAAMPHGSPADVSRPHNHHAELQSSVIIPEDPRLSPMSDMMPRPEAPPTP